MSLSISVRILMSLSASVRIHSRQPQQLGTTLSYASFRTIMYLRTDFSREYLRMYVLKESREVYQCHELQGWVEILFPTSRSQMTQSKSQAKFTKRQRPTLNLFSQYHATSS